MKRRSKVPKNNSCLLQNNNKKIDLHCRLKQIDLHVRFDLTCNIHVYMHHWVQVNNEFCFLRGSQENNEIEGKQNSLFPAG